MKCDRMPKHCIQNFVIRSRHSFYMFINAFDIIFQVVNSGAHKYIGTDEVRYHSAHCKNVQMAHVTLGDNMQGVADVGGLVVRITFGQCQEPSGRIEIVRK